MNFNSRVIAVFFLLSPEAGDKNGSFVYMMGCKNRKPLTAQYYYRVSVVYPHDLMASWELQLAAAAQNHQRVCYHVSLAWEKIKVQNLKYSLY